MKKTLFVMLLIAAMAFSLAAQVQGFYVDIPTAQAEIDELTADNNEMTAANDAMKAENDEMALSNSDLEGLIREAYIVLEKLDENAGTLYALFQTVNDSDQRSQLNDAMVENRKQEYQLEQKKEEIQAEVDLNKTNIANNQRAMAQNSSTIARNERRIEILQASIELSQNEGTSLDDVFSDADSIRAEVEALLAQ